MELSILLSIVGAIGGFLVGMNGIGGGLIYIIVLQSVFASFSLEGYETTRFTLANAMLVQAIAGTAAGYRAYKTDMFRWREVLFVGLPAALVSMSLSYLVKSSNWYRREFFLGFFLLFLCFSIVRIIQGMSTKKKGSKDAWLWEHRANSIYFFTGLLTGVVSAFAGLGGGIFIIPWLHHRHKVPLKQAIAIAVPAVVVGAVGNTFVYMLGSTQSGLLVSHTGYIVWSVVLPMTVGVIIFTQLGVIAATKVSTLATKRLFAAVLVVVAIKLAIVDIGIHGL